MAELNDNLNTGITVVGNCLIITLPNYIEDSDIEKDINKLLLRINGTGIKGAILDLSMITALDSYGFSLIQRTSKTISLMGVRVIWVGLKPGVVASLIDLQVDISNVKAAINLEQGLSLINNE